jgi:Stage II sporulation protein E (SpoIIE).
MSQLIDYGVASLAMSGQTESGDGYIVAPNPFGVLVGVVDGLGHGLEAGAVAIIAVATLQAHAHESIISLMIRCHQALIKTRGAVMSLASFNAREKTLTWLGVGNVEGVLLRVDPKAKPAYEWMLLRAGLVGYQLPPLRASVIPLTRGDTLILFTDGIFSKAIDELTVSDSSTELRKASPQQVADHLLTRYTKGTDDALVLVARYVGNTP